jgi:hypothetical protein
VGENMKPEDITMAQIELTTRCNQKCMFCCRTKNLENPAFKIKDMDFEILKKMNFEIASFVSSRSEPTLYPRFFDVIDCFRKKGTIIHIYSNATTHNPKWWAKLAKNLKYHTKNISQNRLFFAIDLKKHWKRYRDVDSFDKMFENVKAFTDNGGIAWAHMILFKHNENEIEETKWLAKELNCRRFRTKISWNFNDECERPEKIGTKTRWEICNTKKENIYQCSHYINREVVIDVDGIYAPCCHTLITQDNRYSHYMDANPMVILKYQKSKLSGELNDLESALKSEYFGYILNNMDKAMPCKVHCKEFDQQDAYLNETVLNVVDIYRAVKPLGIELKDVAMISKNHPRLFLVDVYKRTEDFIDLPLLTRTMVEYPNQNFLHSTSRDQIEAKRLLVNVLNKCFKGSYSIAVIGGWHGILSLLLKKYAQFNIRWMASYDIDSECTQIAKTLGVGAETEDMFRLDYTDYDIIINPSCEHVDKDWIDKIPSGKIVVAQSTNMNYKSHINKVDTLEDFKKQLGLSEIKTIQIDKRYSRFTVIGVKCIN